MTRRRNRLTDAVAPALLAAATGWLSTTAWHDFTATPWRFAYPLLAVAAVVAGIGLGLRRLRLPAALVVLAQLVAGAVLAGSLAAGELVLTAEGWQRLGQALAGAVDSAQRYQSPVPADVPPIEPLLILGGALCLVLVDFFACTLRRAPLAGLPLLTIYSLPVSLVPSGVPWWSFVLTAIGFLAMLFWQQRDQTSRWGRSMQGEEHALDSPTVRAAAGSVGATALALAVIVPLFVPTLSLSVFGFGPGNGDDGSVTVENPMADLRRDLTRGDDAPLIRFTTDDPNPDYLRIAALTRFTDNEWSPGSRSLPTDQRATGAVPTEDLGRVRRKTYGYDVEVLPDFHSRWLPTAFPISRVSATGDWRYDTATLDFLAFDDGLDTSGLDYQMTGVVPEYSPQALNRAPAWSGRVDQDYIDLPENFPPLARNLALDVTRDYSSRYAKAVALQNWFREDGGFSYSLDNVPPGNGTDELAAFLTEGDGGRVGYCEQFAAAMAAMARSLGIPARVAVGFLEPARVGPHTYEYSAYDMHAWPELYFADAGWVRFEPTPSDRAPGVPSYTRFQLPQPDDTASSEQQSQSRGTDQSLGPDRQLDPGNAPTDQSSGGTGSGALPWLVAFGVLLLVAVLLLTPRLVRRARSRRRLHGDIELAWDELRDTAADLGLPWPAGRSPRETRHALVAFLGRPVSRDTPERPRRGADVAPEAVAALDLLVRELELSRYARPGSGSAASGVVDAVRTVVASLRGGASRRARRRATWSPASVLPWRRPPVLAQSPVLVRHGSVVDQVG